MPIWSEILREIQPGPDGVQDFDGVRRKYLLELHAHTGRNVILYASGWLQKPDVPDYFTAIADEDIYALMEVTAGLSGDKVDLIIHSPGGSPEAAEAIVSYLRSRYKHIRIIVPHLAMSAATMICCATDQIVMGKHSFLGPTDPQLMIGTSPGPHLIPAHSILKQFDRAQQECSDPEKLAAWLPILQQLAPGILVQCENSIEWSRELVKGWLEAYMFRTLEDKQERAEEVSAWLANHANFGSHSRHIPRDELADRGLEILNLEEDEVLQDLSLSVFHATTHALAGTSVAKIVENHRGRAFIKHAVLE